jgi:hypothetical protein
MTMTEGILINVQTIKDMGRPKTITISNLYACKFYPQKPQEALNLLVTEEC